MTAFENRDFYRFVFRDNRMNKKGRKKRKKGKKRGEQGKKKKKLEKIEKKKRKLIQFLIYFSDEEKIRFVLKKKKSC